MTRRLESKYSVCKKIRNNYKNLWGIDKTNIFRCLNFQKKQKNTSFGKLLNIKQSFKSFYSNVKELAFKKYIAISVKSESKTIDKLTSILESRLDTILFRSCLVTSFHEARLYINHRFILVNDLCISTPNKILTKGDIIKLNICESKLSIFDIFSFQKRLISRGLPCYLELDLHNLSVIFLWDVNFKNAYFPVNLIYQNITRYYK
jgi:small subunit ribosomal protein S4